MRGAYALVRGGSASSNVLEPQPHRESKACRGLSDDRGGSTVTKPSLTTALQGVHGA